MAAKETWKHEEITQVKYFNARLDRKRILVNATNSLAASTNHLDNYEIHEWFHSGQPPNFSFYLLLRITYPHHFVIISLHFKGLLKQLSKHNYNWLAGSPFWVSEVLDKHIHIQGGYLPMQMDTWSQYK